MNLSKIRIVQLAVLILWLRCCHTIFDTVIIVSNVNSRLLYTGSNLIYRIETNKMHLDRFVCEKPEPESSIRNLSCVAKYISWNNVKIDMNWYLPKPVDIVWVNLDIYHKFNSITYQKFPINVWDNFCDFLEGKRYKTFGLNWLLGKLMPFSNINRCPLQGLQYFRSNNFSMDNFNFNLSLMPSGNYRVDCTVTDGDRVKLLKFKVFGSISDHRLDVF